MENFICALDFILFHPSISKIEYQSKLTAKYFDIQSFWNLFKFFCILFQNFKKPIHEETSPLERSFQTVEESWYYFSQGKKSNVSDLATSELIACLILRGKKPLEWEDPLKYIRRKTSDKGWNANKTTKQVWEWRGLNFHSKALFQTSAKYSKPYLKKLFLRLIYERFEKDLGLNFSRKTKRNLLTWKFILMPFAMYRIYFLLDMSWILPIWTVVWEMNGGTRKVWIEEKF